MLRKIKNHLAAVNTVIRRHRKGSDIDRWSQQKALSEKWDSRTEQIAKLIPANSHVLEFGAGRMLLKNFLPKNCDYTPSDIVSRGAGTLVCDLNADSLPEFTSEFDVVVFSGVLEYINDVPRLISHLSKTIPVIVTSYATIELKPKLLSRRKSGWVNDYEQSEFTSIFFGEGYELDLNEHWHAQEIYRFVKKAQ